MVPYLSSFFSFRDASDPDWSRFLRNWLKLFGLTFWADPPCLLAGVTCEFLDFKIERFETLRFIVGSSANFDFTLMSLSLENISPKKWIWDREGDRLLLCDTEGLLVEDTLLLSMTGNCLFVGIIGMLFFYLLWLFISYFGLLCCLLCCFRFIHGIYPGWACDCCFCRACFSSSIFW